MSTRTLQRRLESHATSHRALLDETRFDLDLSYLGKPSMSVTSLAFILGFSDVGGFTRAFKRWTGTTVSALREAHAGDPDASGIRIAVRRARQCRQKEARPRR